MVFLRELVLYPVSVHVASAVAAQQDDAQDLLDALSSVARVGVFPQIRGFRASFGEFCSLVLGNSVRVWGILALALKFFCSLFP